MSTVLMARAARALRAMSVAALLGVVGSATCAAAATADVSLADGTLRGSEADGIAVFRSIPYAAPPVGALRFAPPQPVAPWQGVRDATHDAPACPQPPTGDPAGRASDTEDCLYLNVFAPASASAEPAASAQKRPVLVWIHGGGWQEGYGGASQYDPTALVREGGVVVVSINYRLGPLGLLALPSLDDGANRSGNQLIRDQLAALRWVQANIAAFGGDPSRVTVAGESAGANSALALLASPLSKGLFVGAIVQSGVDDAHINSRQVAYSKGDRFASDVGCPAGPQQADCLRALPVSALLAGWRKLPIAQDDELFPVDPYAAFQQGQFNRVPVLIGSNLHEDYLFVSGAEDSLKRKLDEHDYRATLDTTFGPLAKTAATLYPPGRAPSPAAALGNAVTDLRFSCYMNLARDDMARYTKVFGYELNQPDPPQQQPRTTWSLANTSYHTTDLGYLFDNANGPLTGKDAALGRTLRGYWINFVRSGNPNGSGLPAWPRFSDAQPLLRELSSTGGVSADFASRHRCEAAQDAGLVTHDWP